MRRKTENILDRSHQHWTQGLFVFSLVIVLFSFIPAVHAMERSGDVLQQLERQERLPEKRPPERPVIEKESRAAKGGVLVADEEKIPVRRFTIRGATILAPEYLHSLIAAHENKELTLDDISMAAEVITDAYRRHGYLIVYAFIPVQDIRDGEVGITVLEGKVSDITVAGNTQYSTPFIKGHLERTRLDPSLSEQTLERSLLILNDNASLRVKTAIRAGEKPGTADIVASAADARPVSGSISYDNFGSSTTSKHRASVLLDAGNLATDGDRLFLRGVKGLDSIDFNNLFYGKAEYLIPLDHNGSRLGIAYANSIYEAGESLAALQVKGKAHVAGISFTHPLVRQRDKNLNIRVGFDYKNIYDYLLDSLNGKDALRVAHAGINYDFFDPLQGRSILAFAYHQGLSGFLGGAGKDETGTSRLGADGNFSKFTFDFARIQAVGDASHLLARVTGQVSSGPLFAAEQFGIGGMGTVRGFAPSTYSGDLGYLMSVEWHLPPPFSERKVFGRELGETLKIVFFADHAGVFREELQPGESRDDYLGAVGLGLRLNIGSGIVLRLDHAVPYVNGSFSANDAQVYLQLTAGF